MHAGTPVRAPPASSRSQLLWPELTSHMSRCFDKEDPSPMNRLVLLLLNFKSTGSGSWLRHRVTHQVDWMLRHTSVPRAKKGLSCNKNKFSSTFDQFLCVTKLSLSTENFRRNNDPYHGRRTPPGNLSESLPLRPDASRSLISVFSPVLVLGRCQHPSAGEPTTSQD